MAPTNQIESGVRTRTRLAILEAARKMLPGNPNASILEIADVAGVGRSTVHRHFQDRAELVQELALYVYKLSNEAIARAKPESGPPVAALRRIIEEQFDLGPALDFIYNERTVRMNPQLFKDFTAGDEQVTNAIKRASRTDQRFPPDWQDRVFWSLLRLGSEEAAGGHARHEMVDAIMTTLISGFIGEE